MVQTLPASPLASWAGVYRHRNSGDAYRGGGRGYAGRYSEQTLALRASAWRASSNGLLTGACAPRQQRGDNATAAAHSGERDGGDIAGASIKNPYQSGG